MLMLRHEASITLGMCPAVNSESKPQQLAKPSNMPCQLVWVAVQKDSLRVREQVGYVEWIPLKSLPLCCTAV